MIKIGKSASNISVYTCGPQNKKELKKIIDERIKSEGPNCDLNDIDVSKITDMSELFHGSDFNGNISNWNVSNVKNMTAIFYNSKFNQDISNWDVSNVENMGAMFDHSNFNQPIEDWNVSNVKNMAFCFAKTNFNCDISNWKINKDCYTWNMFYNCPIKEEYKPKLPQKK